MKPPAGYLIHVYDEDHFELDIPEQWETVLFPTLQEAVQAAWEHSRGNTSQEASEPLAGPLAAREQERAAERHARGWRIGINGEWVQ